MHLIIDIGNTLTKVATFAGDQLQGLWTGPFEAAPGAIRERMQEQEIQAAIVSTVRHKQGEVPETLRFLQDAGVRVIVARHDLPLPISIHYITRETLGTDRIAAAVAGQAFSPGEAALIINAGTCLTTDLVTANGEYLGGTIAPGLQMRLQAMHHFTGNLPLIDHQTSTKNPDTPQSQIHNTNLYQYTTAKKPGTNQHTHDQPTPQTDPNISHSPSTPIPPQTSNLKPQTSNLKPQTSNLKLQTPNPKPQTPNPFPLPGRTTHESMLLGVKAGMVAEIDGLIEQYRNEAGFFNVILSGGDIKIFDKKLKNRIFAVDNIVLHGLNQMLIHNA